MNAVHDSPVDGHCHQICGPLCAHHDDSQVRGVSTCLVRMCFKVTTALRLTAQFIQAEDTSAAEGGEHLSQKSLFAPLP